MSYPTGGEPLRRQVVALGAVFTAHQRDGHSSFQRAAQVYDRLFAEDAFTDVEEP